MSILAQQTHITLCNKSNFHLNLKILAEQSEDFRMTAGSHENIIPITRHPVHSNTLFSSLVNTAMDIFIGSKLNEINIDFPPLCTVPITLRCTSSLSFTTSLESHASQEAIEHMPGEFDLGPEHHGVPLFLEWKATMGVGYHKDGNVTLGTAIPYCRDMSINTEFFDRSHQKIIGPDITPMCCKIKHKDKT